MLLLEELDHINAQSKSFVIFGEQPDETELDLEQHLEPWFDPTRYRSIGFLERELETYFIVHLVPVEPLSGDDLE